MATRVRAGRSDKTVMGASRTGSYEVTATRPDVRTDATGHGRQISAKTARRRSALRVRPRPMAPQTSSLSGGRLVLPVVSPLPEGDGDPPPDEEHRSEERRVGKECRSR